MRKGVKHLKGNIWNPKKKIEIYNIFFLTYMHSKTNKPKFERKNTSQISSTVKRKELQKSEKYKTTKDNQRNK